MTLTLPPRLASVLDRIATPAYVADLAILKNNMAAARRIRAEAGCRILLATKAFALPALFPLMKESLDGTTASGIFEARLGRETFGKEVHAYAPAFTEGEVRELLKVADHIYFNSPEQIRRFLPLVKASGLPVKTGIRINPGFSRVTVGGELYDPCAPASRFGVKAHDLDSLPWDDIDVLHVHSLCEVLHKDSIGLISHVGERFAPYIKRVKAVNFGGGHFFNKPEYDVGALIASIKDFRRIFNVDVILEPGGALVLDAGYLVSTVLDTLHNESHIAIMDTSAACHMPDVLEAPYTPPLFDSDEPGVLPFTYILGGKSCMTGDVIGTYSFRQPLKIGDRLVFGDMMQYSFVKNNTFNGVPLPDIVLLHEDGKYEVIRRFGYEDFLLKLK